MSDPRKGRVYIQSMEDWGQQQKKERKKWRPLLPRSSHDRPTNMAGGPRTPKEVGVDGNAALLGDQHGDGEI